MVIDVIFFAIAVYTFYLGHSKGIISAFFKWFSVAVGLLIALRFSEYMEAPLKAALDMPEAILPMVAFLLTFGLAMLLVRLFAIFLDKVVDAVELEILNKIGGGLLFAGFATLIYSGLLIFLEKSKILSPEATSGSQFYPYLRHFPSWVASLSGKVAPLIQDMWSSTVEAVDVTKDVIEADSTGKGL